PDASHPIFGIARYLHCRTLWPLGLLLDGRLHPERQGHGRSALKGAETCYCEHVKVLALTRYASLGVTSRIRFLQYIPYLTKAGCDVTVGHFLNDEYVS